MPTEFGHETISDTIGPMRLPRWYIRAKEVYENFHFATIWGALVALPGAAMTGFVAWLRDAPWFLAIPATAIAYLVLAAIITVALLMARRVLRQISPHGGAAGFLRARLGIQMWPVILMASGVVIGASCFAVGAIWFLINLSSPVASAAIPAVPQTAATQAAVQSEAKPAPQRRKHTRQEAESI